VGTAMARSLALARSRELRLTPAGRPRSRLAPRAAPGAPSAPAYQASATTWTCRPGQAAAMRATSWQASTCLVGPVLVHHAKATGRAIGRWRNGRLTTIAAITQLCPQATVLRPGPLAAPS